MTSSTETTLRRYRTRAYKPASVTAAPTGRTAIAVAAAPTTPAAAPIASATDPTIGMIVPARSVASERDPRSPQWSAQVLEATAYPCSGPHSSSHCPEDKDDLGFAIETLDDPPLLVGLVGIWGARPKDRCAELGIALGREYIGRGYGSDATRVIVNYGFREMGLHRIQLSVAPFNLAGIRAYEKAGFVEEGHHRESVLHDGRWYDEVLDVHPRPRVGGPPIAWPMSQPIPWAPAACQHRRWPVGIAGMVQPVP